MLPREMRPFSGDRSSTKAAVDSDLSVANVGTSELALQSSTRFWILRGWIEGRESLKTEL